MKAKITFLLALSFGVYSYSQDILISGVGHDFEANHGLIEIYVKNDIPFAQYYVKSIRPDLSVIGTLALFVTASAGDRIYITSDDFYWNGFFGIPYDYGAQSVGLFQGDDAIVIEDQFNALIDIYGELGVDGTGTAWEFSRGWAYRLDGFGPNTTFTLSEWNIQDDAFIFCSGTNASCTDPYPIGSYTLSSNSKEIPKFRILPNPTNKGYIQILGNNSASINVEVFDVLGQQITHTKLKGDYLDTSTLKTGVYFLKITLDNASETKKLIIN